MNLQNIARYSISAGPTPDERCGLLIDRDEENGEWVRFADLVNAARDGDCSGVVEPESFDEGDGGAGTEV